MHFRNGGGFSVAQYESKKMCGPALY